jgi:site-specific DNA-methyltransferase (adenine-specific)
MQGDCLGLMNDIDDKSIDMVLCDLPYGVTKNKLDIAIPFELLWKQYERIVKDNGAIVLFGQDKFTAHLMLSNEKYHRYNLIWNKILVSGFLNANRMPLRCHEDICVFYKKCPTYNPQKTIGSKNHSKGSMTNDNTNNNYGKFDLVDNAEKLGNLKFPTSILTFQKPHPSTTVHCTQKPVDLLEYLIKTYTNEGELVLDNCMGSGSTGVACINTNRRFIGIEKDNENFEIAKKSIHNSIFYCKHS